MKSGGLLAARIVWRIALAFAAACFVGRIFNEASYAVTKPSTWVVFGLEEKIAGSIFVFGCLSAVPIRANKNGAKTTGFWRNVVVITSLSAATQLGLLVDRAITTMIGGGVIPALETNVILGILLMTRQSRSGELLLVVVSGVACSRSLASPQSHPGSRFFSGASRVLATLFPVSFAPFHS